MKHKFTNLSPKLITLHNPKVFLKNKNIEQYEKKLWEIFSVVIQNNNINQPVLFCLQTLRYQNFCVYGKQKQNINYINPFLLFRDVYFRRTGNYCKYHVTHLCRIKSLRIIFQIPGTTFIHKAFMISIQLWNKSITSICA